MKFRTLFLILCIFLFFILILGFSSASYSLSNPKYIYGGTTSSFLTSPFEFDNSLCQQSQDFILQVDPAGCNPTVVRSDLLEEQTVPVFCPIQATKINPLVDVNFIRNINFGGDIPKEINPNIGFHPSSSALGPYLGSGDVKNAIPQNIGYVVFFLRQQKNESAMPEYVEGNLTAKIRYDVENAFGIRNNKFYLEVLDDAEWDAKKNQYSFWDRKGYLRAENVDSASATIGIYSDVYKGPIEGNVGEKRKITSINLDKGQESQKIYLPSFYCLAGMKLKLEDVEFAETRVRLKINSEYIEVKDGEYFLDNACRVKSIDKEGINQKVKIYCRQDDSDWIDFKGDFELSIVPKVHLKINGEDVNATLGQYLYSEVNENNPEKSHHVYLAYAKVVGSDPLKEENLKVYLVAKPGAIQDNSLTLSEIEFEETMAESHEVEYETEDTSFGDFVEALSKVYEWTAKSVQWMYNGDVHKTIEQGNMVENFYGSKVELIGYAGITDYDLNIPNLKEVSSNYNSANENYDAVVDNYFESTDPFGQYESLSEQSFREKISLAYQLKQKATASFLCSEFKEYFPSADEPDECGVKISNSGNSVKEVIIDREVKEISLEGIYEPSPKDYGVELGVRTPEGEFEEVLIVKDKTVYFDEGGLSIKFIEILDEDSVKLFVSYRGNSEKNYEDKFSNFETLNKGSSLKISTGHTIFVEKIYLKNFAKVSLVSDVNHQSTNSTFNFRIYIEKRAIQLAPETIEEKIKNLDGIIEDGEKISENMGNVIKGLKTSCIATATFLTVKNLISNSGGKSIARQEVMRGEGGWHEECSDLDYKGTKYQSIDQCFLKNSPEIDAEVSEVYGRMQAQDKTIKDLQSGTYLETEGIFGGKHVNTSAFIEKYSEDVITDFSGTIEVDGESIDLSEFKEVLDRQNFEEGSYSVDELKQIDLYYKVYVNAEDNPELQEKYEKKLFSVVSQVKANSENYADLKATLGVYSISPNDWVFVDLDEESIEESYRGRTAEDFQGISFESYSNYEGPVQAIYTDKNTKYFVFLDDSIKSELYPIKRDSESNLLVFNTFGKRVEDAGVLSQLGKYNFKIYDEQAYENEYKGSSGSNDAGKGPVVKYYETGNKQGRPAIVPVDTKDGWYAYAREYHDSGRVSLFYLCNVMENGLEERMGGDDKCQMINLETGQPYDQFDGFEDKSKVKSLVDRAVKAIYDASTIKESQRSGRVSIAGNKVYVGNPATEMQLQECADIMSPKECQLLFNLCDPVICPNSRCDFGGKYPVKDVIQTGIIGSLVLCLPNWNEGVYMPVCLTGLKAGLDSWLSISKSYRDCLQENLETGETVGICDELHSVYMCEFFWRQALPILKEAIPRLLSVVAGQNTRGGGEYLGVASAWQTAQNSVDYFTNYYASNSYNAFKVRSVEQAGTEVCKNFISVAYPGGVDILDAFTDPDSPPQFHGRFDEIPFTTATNPPTSQYKVFYHIYAGADSGAYYSVYLRGGTQSSYYQDDLLWGSSRSVDSGYISKGGYATETIDFTAPSGFKELCINVNGQEECGFSQVSTSFALDYLKDQYVKQQSLQESVTTEKQCVSGTASLYSVMNLNPEEIAGDLIDPEIYNKGIIRICANGNPGAGTDPNYPGEDQRWMDVGHCGDTNMRCWLDTESLDDAFEFEYHKDQTLKELGENYIEKLLNSDDSLMTTEEFMAYYEDYIEGEKNPIKRINLISAILPKLIFGNDKAYSYFQRGNAYAEIAKANMPVSGCPGIEEYVNLLENCPGSSSSDYCSVDQFNDWWAELMKRVQVQPCLVNEQNSYGWTILHDASFYDVSFEEIKTLVGLGADSNLKNELDETSLHLAARSKNLEVIEFLVEEGKANPCLESLGGQTPLNYAQEFNEVDRENVVNYLKTFDCENYVQENPSLVKGVSPKFELGDTGLCFRFFSNQWHWTNDCKKVGTSVINIQSPDSSPIVNTISYEWQTLDKLSTSYGKDVSKQYEDVIINFRDKKSYETGLNYLIDISFDMGFSLKTENVEMSNHKIFEIKGPEEIGEFYLLHRADNWYWSFKKNSAASSDWIELTNLDYYLTEDGIWTILWNFVRDGYSHPNVYSLTKTAKNFLEFLEGRDGSDFYDGAFQIFNIEAYLNQGEFKEDEQVISEEDQYVLSSASERVLKAMEFLNGKDATVAGGYVEDFDSDNDINCYDRAYAVYNYSGVIPKCAYSDVAGMQYPIYGSQFTVKTEDANQNKNTLFAVNPDSCSFAGGEISLREDLKLDLLFPGDFISYYWGQGQPHNAIFVKWKDEETKVAILFDANNGSGNNRKFRYYNVSLMDSNHPVYMFWHPSIPSQSCYVNNEEGVCLNNSLYECSSGFQRGLCPGALEIQCCLGNYSFIGDSSKKDLEEDFYEPGEFSLTRLGEIGFSVENDLCDFTLDSAMYHVFAMRGKYSSSEENTNFLDELCGDCSEEGILSEKECKDFKGEGEWYEPFEWEDGFDNVKEALYESAEKENYDRWNVLTALLRMEISGDEKASEFEDFLYRLLVFKIIDEKFYNEIKYVEGEEDLIILPNLFFYLKNKVEEEYDFDSSGDYFNFEGAKILKSDWFALQEFMKDNGKDLGDFKSYSSNLCGCDDPYGASPGERYMDFEFCFALYDGNGSSLDIAISSDEITSITGICFKDVKDFSALALSELNSLKKIQVGEVECADYEISNIESLSSLTNLESLVLKHNQISDISPLSSLTNLENLSLWDNQISDISPLSILTNLELLRLSDNQISNIGPLSSLTNLELLHLSDNQISNIGPLSSLTNLKDLHLSQNQISDISHLSSLTNLKDLVIPSNQISDISSLSSLTNLEWLSIEDNQISDISPLSSLTNLENLYIEYNQISDISPLSSLTNLDSLYLDGNKISDYSPICGLTKLKFVDFKKEYKRDCGKDFVPWDGSSSSSSSSSSSGDLTYTFEQDVVDGENVYLAYGSENDFGSSYGTGAVITGFSVIDGYERIPLYLKPDTYVSDLVYEIYIDKDYLNTYAHGLFWTGVMDSISSFDEDVALGKIYLEEDNGLYSPKSYSVNFLESVDIDVEQFVKDFRYDLHYERTDSDLISAILYANENSLSNGHVGVKCKCADIYECVEYAYYVEKYSEKHNIDDPFRILALMMQESACKQSAISSYNSYGLMQITQGTFDSNCVNMGFSFTGVKNNAKNNIDCGVWIFKRKYNEYKDNVYNSWSYKNNENFNSTVDSCIERYPKYANYVNWNAALRAYNGWGCGPGADTNYVERITTLYNELKNL